MFISKLVLCVLISFVLFILFYYEPVICDEQLGYASRVNVSNGEIEGLIFTTEKENKAHIFQGIPYVEAPVGHLRFARPRPKSPWNDTLPCNQGYKPACPQNVSLSQYSNQSEDCLYLNVFSGLDCFGEMAPKCAVLYYVHGGANEFESTAMFPVEDLVDNAASRGVVLVTVAYRLGILGFFSTGLDDAPGNWALLDIIEGARWVQKEIKNFGGDPKRVTIMGQSSSAGLVSLLTMSKATRGLFQRAIVMSGSGTTWNAIVNNVTDYMNLVQALNCSSESENITYSGENNGSSEILNCLRQFDAMSLVNNFSDIRGYDSEGVFPKNLVQPRNDGPRGLFPDRLPKMIRNRRPIDLMTGTTKNEYGLNKLFLMDAGPQTIIRTCKEVVDSLGDVKRKESVSEACIEAYMPKRQRWTNSNEFSLKNTPEELLENITETINFSEWTRRSVAIKEDVEYYAPCHLEVSSMLKNADWSANVFLYSFDYEKKNLEGIFPWHASDLSFVLGSHKLNGKLTSDDLQAQAVYLPLFVNFVKFGDPTPRRVNGTRWRAIKARFRPPYPYLSVRKFLSMKIGYHEQAAHFWNKVVPRIDSESNEYSNDGFVSYPPPFEYGPKRHFDGNLSNKAYENEPSSTRSRQILAIFITAVVSATVTVFGMLLINKFLNHRRIADERKSLLSQSQRLFDGYDTL